MTCLATFSDGVFGRLARNSRKRGTLNGARCALQCVHRRRWFHWPWTAYYLKEAKPDLKVVVLEREFAGFGASGRNGGNLTGRFPWVRKTYLKHSSPDRLLAMEKALNKTVFEVMDVARREVLMPISTARAISRSQQLWLSKRGSMR